MSRAQNQKDENKENHEYKYIALIEKNTIPNSFKPFQVRFPAFQKEGEADFAHPTDSYDGPRCVADAQHLLNFLVVGAKERGEKLPLSDANKADQWDLVVSLSEDALKKPIGRKTSELFSRFIKPRSRSKNKPRTSSVKENVDVRRENQSKYFLPIRMFKPGRTSPLAVIAEKNDQQEKTSTVSPSHAMGAGLSE